jgi:hypothetical protein
MINIICSCRRAIINLRGLCPQIPGEFSCDEYGIQVRLFFSIVKTVKE